MGRRSLIGARGRLETNRESAGGRLVSSRGRRTALSLERIVESIGIVVGRLVDRETAGRGVETSRGRRAALSLERIVESIGIMMRRRRLVDRDREATRGSLESLGRRRSTLSLVRVIEAIGIMMRGGRRLLPARSVGRDANRGRRSLIAGRSVSLITNGRGNSGHGGLVRSRLMRRQALSIVNARRTLETYSNADSSHGGLVTRRLISLHFCLS